MQALLPLNERRLPGFFKKLIKKANVDRMPIVVDNSGLSAVIISLEDFELMEKTIYFLQNDISTS